MRISRCVVVQERVEQAHYLWRPHDTETRSGWSSSPLASIHFAIMHLDGKTMVAGW